MSIDFKGEKFEPREKANRMRALYLAKVAREGSNVKEGDAAVLGTAIMNNMAALYEYVEHVLRPEDFTRFMDVCDREGVDDNELYEFGAQMMAVGTDRPTEQSTDSSVGLSSVPESSGSRLEELASEQFPGRPDLWLAATVSERATA